MAARGNSEPLFVRLYLDRHINIQLAKDLRERAYDVLTTQEAGMDTATDQEQLTFASDNNRCIFTFNIRDFVRIHREWTAAGRAHGGIIVSQQLGGRQYGLLLAWTLRLLDQLTADDVRGMLIHLEQFRE